MSTKKLLGWIFAWILPLSSAWAGLRFEGGALIGARFFQNDDLKNAYGGALLVYPHVSLVFGPVFLGGGYHFGETQRGSVGMFQDAAELMVAGPEIFVGLQAKLGPVLPYVKAGAGFYSYEQKFLAAALRDFNVKGRKQGFCVGGGLKLPIGRVFRLAFAFDYLSLHASGIDSELDMSGIRALGGFGLFF
jgi:hypothetical protein